jgi:hypothetical protein
MRICTQLKSCTLTNFWLRDKLYRDTAPVPTIKILYHDSFPAPIKLVPRHSYSSKNLHPDGKKCAIPSLHPRRSLFSRGARRDSFLAKVPGPCPDAASGNRPALQAGSSLSRHQMSGLYARPPLLPGRQTV